MSTDVSTSPAHDLLRLAGLRPETGAALRRVFESTTALITPGFHGPTDIETLAGLPGSYLWFEDPVNVRVMTFTFDSDKPGFQGRYVLAGGFATVEHGTFNAVANNPAVGFAFLVLSPDGGPTRSFPINGMVTDPLERITILLLGQFTGSQIVTAFTAVRLI